MTRGPTSTRLQCGHRAAKESAERAFRDKQRVVHLRQISSSLKRKSDAMEESNALVLFRMCLSEQTAEDVAQCTSIITPLRTLYSI